MKRILLFLGILMLCVSVQGLSLTFQNPSDFTEFVTTTCSGSCNIVWVQSATGGNNYVSVQEISNPGTAYILNKDPLATTYAAATLVGHSMTVGEGYLTIRLYDSSMATLYTFTRTAASVGDGRYEVIMVGGAANIYYEGTLLDTSGALAQNPSYIGFGSGRYGSIAGSSYAYWDQYTYGSTENRYIFDAPESGYYIKRDMVNPAASGFYNSAGTLISSINISTEWGKGSGTSESIQLMEWGNNYVVDSFSSGTAYSGLKSWSIEDRIINNANAPYGYYVITIPGSGKFSQVIPYIADGCTIAFDKDSYARGDTATVTYSIDSGGYWDTTQYLYRLDTLNVYGTVVDSQTVTTQAGSKQVKFETSDPLGVYYTVMIAAPVAGGDDLWMNYDTAELTGYMKFEGKVINGENETVINGANVSISQGTTYFNHITSVDGNYTTNAAFYSGATTYINVTADYFYQYTYSFTPLEAKTIPLNFTLTPLNPGHSGLAVLGTDRDTTYGRPIPYATNTVYNTTYGESYSVTANGAGWYLLDAGDGAYLTDGRLYFVMGSKAGYSNSQAYPVIPRGSI